MTEIAKKFDEISKEVKVKTKNKDRVKMRGIVAGGISIGLGALAAPFTAGLSLVPAGLAGIAAGAVVIEQQKSKAEIESNYKNNLIKQGKKFKEIVDPLIKELEDMNKKCKELEEVSSKFQGNNAWPDMEEFQRYLKLQMSQIEVVMVFIRDLVELIEKIHTLTPDKSNKLENALINSGDECWKSINVFRDIKMKLRDIKQRVKP